MHKRHKKIGLFTAMSFAIGAMIGGGVFVLTGVAMGRTGPSALLSFILAGAIVTLSALSFGKIAAHAKKDEAGYAVVGDILGSPLWAFLASWSFYLSGIIGAAFVLNAFGIYMHNFINDSLPALGWALIGAVGLMLINFSAASMIGKVERLLVLAKLAVLGVLIVAGITHIRPNDFTPFFTHGSSGMLEATAYLFIAYLGFSVITSISGEIKRPQKTIPKAIFLSMIVVMIVYAGIVIALLAAPTNNYSEASVGDAAEQLIGPVGGMLVIIGALVATLSAANANILGSSEIMVRLALQKQVPTVLGHMRRGIPYISVLFSAGTIIVLLLVQQTETIIGLANVMAIYALIIVNYGAAILGSRHFMGWFLPFLGILGAISQFFFMPKLTFLIGTLLFIAGARLYSLRERRFQHTQHLAIKRHIAKDASPLMRALK